MCVGVPTLSDCSPPGQEGESVGAYQLAYHPQAHAAPLHAVLYGVVAHVAREVEDALGPAPPASSLSVQNPLAGVRGSSNTARPSLACTGATYM
jgi:hypothetical protein